MRTNKYWEKRSKSRMLAYHKDSEKTITTVTAAYDKAISDINAELDRIFSKYTKDGKLAPPDALKLLNQREDFRALDALREQLKGIKDPDIKRQPLNRLNAPAYRARLTRLQVLKERIYIAAKKVADVEIRASQAGYIEVIDSAYYHTLFDLQKGIGLGFDVAAIPTKTVEAILKNPWSGAHFSKRVWHNTDVLADRLTEVITSGLKSGASIRKMRQEIEDLGTMGKHGAARLIRTETTYMANAAEMESYEEAEVEEYMFIATLDLRTSKICQKHDHKIYKLSERKPGKTVPPLHPYCRSTTRAWFGPELVEGMKRRARDPKTGKTYLVPQSMTYKQWKERYVA